MQSTYESLFSTYQDTRLLKKLENYSLWTIPSIFPENYEHGKTGNMEIQHDYQSVGATLVNNLAPKLAKLLFPFKQPFFHIEPTDKIKGLIDTGQNDEWRNDLVNLENSASKQLFLNSGYAALLETLKYLIITGNALMIREGTTTVVYGLRNFSILRDNSGKVLDLIIKESKAWGTVSDELKGKATGRQYKDEDSVDLYTRVQRKDIKGTVNYVVTQQLAGVDVNVTETYPENLCPYIPVVWSLRAGDSYGRGLVEELAGDFAKLSDVSLALAKYELETLRLIPLVKPGATTDIDELAKADTGEPVQGNPADIQPYEGGQFAKIQQILADLDVITERLAKAFMYRGNTRQGERVTATEVELNANEADEALGGAISTISAHTHIRLAYLTLMEVSPEFITAVIANEFSLDITAGVASLGRNSDVQALIQAAQVIGGVVPVLTQLSQRIDPERIIDMVFRSYNLDTSLVMRTPEELNQLNEMQQQVVNQADPLAAVQATGEL